MSTSPNLIVPGEARPLKIAPEAIYTSSFQCGTLLIDCYYLGIDATSTMSTWCRSKPGVVTRVKNILALSRFGARKGIRPMKINKTAM